MVMNNKGKNVTDFVTTCSMKQLNQKAADRRPLGDFYVPSARLLKCH
jgi:hypothetical protein